MDDLETMLQRDTVRPAPKNFGAVAGAGLIAGVLVIGFLFWRRLAR